MKKAVVISLAIALAATTASASGASQPRIIGGGAATIQQHPWQVALAINDALWPENPPNGYERFACSGTLVAPTIVVTASHCVYDVFGDGITYNKPSTFEVFTGRTKLSSKTGQVLEVSQLYYPVTGPGGAPAFEPYGGPDLGPELYEPYPAVDWDIAILKLARASTSATIQIAGPDEAATWTAGRPAHASGWGGTTPGLPSEQQTYPDDLQAVDIAVMSDEDCAREIATFDPAVEFCAGSWPDPSRSGCFGDSGGPLVVPVEIGAGTGVRLIGDTSGGPAYCERGYGYYGRLAADPMRAPLQTAVQQLTGVNVVGSGARPIEPPNTKITKHPKKKLKTGKRKVRVKFAIAASEPATFECKLDRKPYAPCGAETKFRVRRGKHKLKVRAIDALGQVEPAPAKHRWKVKRR